MLTPLPLTPDVMPHDYEHLVSLGLTLPCELVPHYSMINMITQIPSTSLLEDRNEIASPEYTTSVRLVESPDERDEDEPLAIDNIDDDDHVNGGDNSHDNASSSSREDEIKDPFSPHCKIPLPTAFSPYAYWLEPSFIRRRNERERQRVRNVNDGFERLKNHLPITSKDKDKRLSKVEILRMAIRYIRSLQDMLKNDPLEDSKENMVSCGQRMME